MSMNESSIHWKRIGKNYGGVTPLGNTVNLEAIKTIATPVVNEYVSGPYKLRLEVILHIDGPGDVNLTLGSGTIMENPHE